MFGFLKRDHKGRTDEAPAPEPAPARPAVRTAPGTEIRYDRQLIPQLKADHQRLLGLYMEILHIFEIGAYGRIGDRLHQFRTEVQEHFMKEKIRLYIYLEHSLPRDSEEFARVHAFRQELEAIGKAVLQFLRKYENIAQERELIDSFEKEFGTIGEVLTKRITAEENQLYPLYTAESSE